MPEERKVPERKVLEKVLHEALLAADAAGAATPEEMQALIEVARRHRGRALDQEPVAADLVEALLCAHFAGWTDSPAAWRKMAGEIARSLEDDPAIRERLDRLWAGVAEAAQ